MSHSKPNHGEFSRSQSSAPKNFLRRFDAAQPQMQRPKPLGSMAPTPANPTHGNRYRESIPPFSLDPDTIGLVSLPTSSRSKPTESKPESHRFRLDHADWIPQPHSAAIQRLGQTLWYSHNEQELSRSDRIPHTPAADLTSRYQPALKADQTRDHSAPNQSNQVAPQLKPAWEVDLLHWPSTSDRLIQEQQTVFTRMLDAFRDRQADLKVIAVTGLRSDDDRSTLAISLARFIALRGEQVTLIDADPMDHSLALRCGVTLDTGWRDFEARQWGEALIRETSSNLIFVPQGVGRPLETSLEAPALSQLLEHLRPHQDWVVVDAGLISGMLAIEPEVLPLFDAAVIIRHPSQNVPDQFESIRRKLAGIGIRFLAFADNLGQRRIAV